MLSSFNSSINKSSRNYVSISLYDEFYNLRRPPGPSVKYSESHHQHGLLIEIYYAVNPWHVRVAVGRIVTLSTKTLSTQPSSVDYLQYKVTFWATNEEVYYEKCGSNTMSERKVLQKYYPPGTLIVAGLPATFANILRLRSKSNQMVEGS